MARVSLQSLQVFCVSAELGSFKRAGEELFVTPSAISHRIKSLEEQLGISLYERQARGVELTPAGRRLVDTISPLLREIDGAVVEFVGDPLRQRVTIALPSFFLTELFIPALPGIAERHPELDIRLVSADSSTDRFPAAADIAIVLAEQVPAEVSSEVLFPLDLVPAASPALKLSREHLLSPDLRVPLLIHRSRRNAWRRWFDREGIKAHRKIKVIEMDSMFAVVRAAEQGLGVALVPSLLIRKWVASGAIDILCRDGLPTKDKYCLCWRGQQRPAFAEAIFDGLLAQEA